MDLAIKKIVEKQTVTPFEICSVLELLKNHHLLKKTKIWLKGKVADPEEFCSWLKKTGTVMAGSAPLQILLGQDWKDSDIDLYVMDQSSHNRKLDRYPVRKLVQLMDSNSKFDEGDDVVVSLSNMKKFFKLIDHITSDTYSPYIYITQYDINDYSEMGCLMKNRLYYKLIQDSNNICKYDRNVDISKVHTYRYQGECKLECPLQNSDKNTNSTDSNAKECPKCTHIQIIHINPDKHSDIKSFIDSFDLDFCKVLFDGEKFDIMYPESIKTKSSVQKSWTQKQILSDRAKKYKARGFNILTTEDFSSD